MRFFLCVVLSAAALWSCGGDGDGEPGPEPPVPPVVDPNAVEVVNSGFEKGLEGWTRVDFHNGGKVTVEVVETEPVVKGQTASSSYKPAVAHNGVRIMVPPHIGVGTRVIINTADLTYVERAKS